jgi:hypothetical protein
MSQTPPHSEKFVSLFNRRPDIWFISHGFKKFEAAKVRIVADIAEKKFFAAPVPYLISGLPLG